MLNLRWLWLTQDKHDYFVITMYVNEYNCIIHSCIICCFSFYYTAPGDHIFIIYALWSFDMMMNCICLYLDFTFADKISNTCCGLCHGLCDNMFEFCAAKKILKHHLDEQNLAAILLLNIYYIIYYL